MKLKLLLFLLFLTTISTSSQNWNEIIKATASDAAVGDYFGYSVSISGSKAIVGAHLNDDAGNNSGAAYIFEEENGTWTQVAKLTASDAALEDYFGWSVSISGSTAIVGSRLDDDNGSKSGSAYIFEEENGTWTEVAKLTASDAAANDEFGVSVSISGSTAIVGAHSNDDAGINSGSAYIFEKENDTWTEAAKLTASDAASADYFGWSVSISGSYTIIGAYANDDAGINSGSAYIFEKENDAWTEAAILIASDTAAVDFFGLSVSISGSKAIVGAHYNDAAGTNSGSAYVFEEENGVWTQATKLTASDPGADDYFGHSVSISGSTTIVGSFRNDAAGSNSGSAYIFEEENGVWTQATKLTASNAAVDDRFGFSVSISGSKTIVGANFNDDAGSNSGSAYFYSSEIAADVTPPVLSNVTMSSSNSSRGYAKEGDVITLSFSADEVINTPTVTIAGLSATVSSLGGNNWSATYTVDENTPQGAATFLISGITDGTNAAANVSALSSGSAVVVDTIVPSIPTLDLQDGEDTGISDSDYITQYDYLYFEGTTDVGTTVEFFDGNTLLAGAYVDQGDWYYEEDAPELSDGDHNFTVVATDAAGNTSTSAILVVTIDTEDPSLPTLDLDASSDLGVSDTDDFTSDNTPLFVGTTEADTTVELFLLNLINPNTAPQALGSAVVVGTAWSFTSPTLSDGVNVVIAVSSDLAGNTSVRDIGITVNTVKPVLTLLENENPQIIEIIDEADAVYEELGATAIDDADGDITESINIDTSALDVATVGCYPVVYTIMDDSGNTETATRVVFVLEEGMPWAKDDIFNVGQDSSNNALDITNNDSYGTDEAREENSISLYGTYSTHGGKIDIEDGVVRYTPRAGFKGVDDFRYLITDATDDSSTATVTINVDEEPSPTAVDDVVTVTKNSGVTAIDVLLNDTYGADGEAGSGALTTSGTSEEGGITVINTGKIDYTPATDFTGLDSFFYTITDLDGDTSEAVVLIRVVEDNSGTISRPMIAKPDAFTVSQNTTDNVFDVFADNGSGEDDFGSAGLKTEGLTMVNGTYEGTSHQGGVLEINGNDLIYTPKTGFIGEDGFYYSITDTNGATSITIVTITVEEIATPTAVADAVSVVQDSGVTTIDVLANDSFGSDGAAASDSLALPYGTGTALGGTVVVNGGAIDYTPPVGDTGTDSFQYTIEDASGDISSDTTVTITIIPPGLSDTPTAQDDAVTFTQNSADNVISILADNGNGVDEYGSDGPRDTDPISLYGNHSRHGGELLIVGNTVQYTPRTDFVGTDEFRYLITDSTNESSTATVTIDVQQPVATKETDGTALNSDFMVYPNPSKGDVNLSVYSTQREEVSVVLFDVTGKVIYNKIETLSIGNNTLDFHVNVKSSVMFVKVYSEHTNFGTKKVVFK